MITAESYQALIKAIEVVDRIMIVTHVHPDGDAIGSTLGLRGILEAAGKKAEVIIDDNIVRKYRFLVDRSVLKIDDPMLRDMSEEDLFQMVIFVDASERERAGRVLDHMDEWLVDQALEVNIDHHVSNDSFGDISIVDSKRASSAEMILELAESMGVECTPMIAQQLFAGILTDTGRFQFSNTDPQSLRTAATLVEAGADPLLIAQRIYLERPKPFYQLLGHLLSSIESYHEGRTCILNMPGELASRFFSDGHLDTEGIVDYTVQIAGVEVGIFVRQTGDGIYRASFRSRGIIDVRLVAEAFGRGGHEKAAGCEIRGSLEEVKDRIVTEVGLWLT